MLYVTSTSMDKEGNINIKNKDIVSAKNYLNNLIKNSQNNLSEDVDHNNNIENINLTFLGTETQDLKSLDVADTSCLEE